MFRPSLVPTGLFLLLLLSSSAFAAEPTSPASDAFFYHIAKHARHPEEPPVCCLRPLTTGSEPASEEILLSFEEWKVKQEEALLQKQQRADGSGSKTGGAHSRPGLPETQKDSVYEGSSSSVGSPPPPPLEPPPPPPPHFRVPLTDRFNYASLDCSARVHYAHRSARSTSSLLSSKKDKYMLSPCNTPGEDHFIVVELCEDIRIDTVQLANFEFFSGVFKDFSVSVAGTYTTDPDGWTPAGTYRAKNVRGIQSFHPPTSLRDFYRFIRIDFHSYYGNEYYCPISLLRVYGLTHLEQWKWDVWEAEYKAKSEAQATMRSIAAAAGDAGFSASAEDNIGAVKLETDGTRTESSFVQDASAPSKTSMSYSENTDTPMSGTKVPESFREEEDGTGTAESVSISSHISSVTTVSAGENGQLSSLTGSGGDESSIPSSSSNGHIPSESASPYSETLPIQSPSPGEPSQSESPMHDTTSSIAQASDPISTHLSQKVESASTSIPSTTMTPIPTIVAQESRAITTTGESIYRTIMTRLSILETNSSLYLRYVEEQTRSLRDALTRLEEDVGRLEGLSKATTQSFQKIINEMDRQRRRLEREHGELQTRVDYLTDEVILEKRLGIAQLCLLLVVLVFIALTRGSRGEPFIAGVSSGRRNTLREWGRRHLSSLGSGEWASKLRSGSPVYHPEDIIKSPIPLKKTEMVRFPTERTLEKPVDDDETPRGSSSSLSMAIPSSSSTKGHSLAEIRAPHPRHFISHHRPRTPTSAGFTAYSQATRSAGVLGASTTSISSQGRPRLRRASSHSSPVPVAYSLSSRAGNDAAPSLASAKKWAKSAHLHEIRKRSPRRVADMSGTSRGKGLASASASASAAQSRRDQENFYTRTSERAGPTEASVKLPGPKEPRDAALLDFRDPLSISPLQNRLREGGRSVDLNIGKEKEKPGLSGKKGRKQELWQAEPNTNGGPKVIDVDTESENWEDTSAGDSETDD